MVELRLGLKVLEDAPPPQPLYRITTGFVSIVSASPSFKHCPCLGHPPAPNIYFAVAPEPIWW